VRMDDPRAESSFTKEPFDRRGVFAIAFFEDLDCGEAPFGMFCPIHCGGATFTDSLQKAIPSDRATSEILRCHGPAAN